MENARGATDNGFNFVGLTLKMYNSFIKTSYVNARNYVTIPATAEIENSIIEGWRPAVNAGADFVSTIFYTSERLTFNNHGTYNDIILSEQANGFYSIRFWSNPVYAYECKGKIDSCRESQWYWRNGVIIGTKDETKISGWGYIYEQYSTDIRVSRNGVAIENATVTCKDKNGDTVFSVDTAATGKIAQQWATVYKAYRDGATIGNETLTPFDFEISKTGHQIIYIKSITQAKAIDWEVELPLEGTGGGISSAYIA